MKVNNLIAGALNLNSKDYKKGGKKVFLIRVMFFLQYFRLKVLKKISVLFCLKMANLILI